MAFFFTCGTHTFESRLKGYEDITVRCQNCGNWSGKINKRWQWFTICFVPLIPFSFKPWHEVSCGVCRFKQDIKYRPDAQEQMENGSRVPMQPGPQSQNEGWGGGPPPGQGYQGGPPPNQGWEGGGGQPGHGHPAYK